MAGGAERSTPSASASTTTAVGNVSCFTFGLAQIDSVAPAAGEDERIDAELERLMNADALRGAVRTARLALTGNDDGGRGRARAA